MIYIIGPPVKVVLNSLESWLMGLQQGSALMLGLILGAMMAFDMGGPVNKAAYTFSVGLLASEIYTPMAAVMAAGMVPPLGLAPHFSKAVSRTKSMRPVRLPMFLEYRLLPRERFLMPPVILSGLSPASW
jgi:fructose-specific phosphotransferase system IIC component